mmetsp:Transcript_8343/g.16926  ORF Transcript_8343/g.16926 Transcript_8343/m.16926 type:complete len:114 (-) Transcript_8343:46-387(-)
MSQSFQPTSFSHLSFEPIISLSSITEWSRLAIVRLSLRTNFPGFSLLQECQSPTFHDAIGNFVYASSHLFLTLESAIFHSSPSTFSTRWHHHYFPQDTLHQSSIISVASPAIH